MKRKIDKFFDHIESIASTEGVYFPICDDPEIFIASYAGVPEEGCITAFSFGLSNADCPEWINSRPELLISMDTRDDAWGLAMGELIKNGWGKSLFSYGEILNFGQSISKESEMSAFLVFSCSILEPEDVRIELDDRIVNISQLYPIYQQEIPLIRKVGAESFFLDYEIDFFDPGRKPVIIC